MIKSSKFNFNTAGFVLLVALAGGLSVRADSLVRPQAKSLFADKKGVAVGDIITIIVQENTSSSKDNSTSTSRKASLDAQLQSLFYSGVLAKAGEMPAVKFNSASGFDGGGKVNNTETITARVAVQVIDVLPNNTLVIEGRKQTKINGETSDVILRGVVRAEDVAADNTVFSYNVANAEIHIVDKGLLRDQQRPGWFHRLWDKISPF